ncbi:FAD-dependent oxidoreductase [Actinoplanes philippinensis]|uniref:2-polyprenyl-6-methoxyphenol hydroxylase n=1 Tax=Actinoplanes philippinensis TaxID=35752 RepID=A0A1I2HWV8_9ACTN|nr:FAD-dependent monooxygenase [Actinoplanes philippinensis]GIE78891.1 FAD-dependent oxidoreductase [Actinoplanes philippinensis]SFF34509.1 2-polyprenyl-6-methoxyphenol hydroxylase [Actinoplanes philippinensis]
MIDALIIGAGPNGLMLACELALAGIHPVILERHPTPTHEPRANGLIGQVVKLLDRRGLHSRLTGNPDPPTPQPAFTFGGFPLDLTTLHDNPHYGLGIPQAQLEAALTTRALELGADIRRGHHLTDLHQHPDSIEATLADGTRITTRYLIGADGGRSTVRRLAGIDFPGVTHDRTISRTANVTIPTSALDPHTGAINAPGYGTVPPFQHTRTPHGLIVWAPFPGRPAILGTTEWPDTPTTDDDTPMTLDELRTSVTRVLGTEIPINPPDHPGLLRRLTAGNTRIATRYRTGRILLLGDAAHVHPAIGGPGLNLGLQDAANLGWKLAATLHGWAPPDLLDTYETERRPVAERVVMSTRAQSALISPGDDITGLRQLFTELLHKPEVTAHIAALMSGADTHYPSDPTDPLAGRITPDLTIHTDHGPRTLAELTRTARPLLLDSTGAYAPTAAPWNDRVDIFTGHLEGTTATALLVRPDCFTAWSAGTHDTLRAALTRHFGAPARTLADAVPET